MTRIIIRAKLQKLLAWEKTFFFFLKIVFPSHMNGGILLTRGINHFPQITYQTYKREGRLDKFNLCP